MSVIETRSDAMLYLTFAISVALLIVSPGPMVSLIIAESRNQLPKATILGALLSAQILLLLSLTAIINAFSFNENLLKIGQLIGGGYLIYVAVMSYFSSLDTEQVDNVKSRFFKAIKIGLSNPKDILFFIAFLPNFISLNDNYVLHSATLMVIWLIIDLSIMLGYSYFARKIFAYQFGQMFISKVPCVTMILFGLMAVYTGAHSLLF
ncbi:LysE family translocator [Vibrio zhugei]|uniref:LysE family translocator n=2 Tax=Vibrio zhugei TaxID=2479546 RepID=A0ABV7C8B5_9VIBR|nr:LysE family transporter [Vibrio zhugei]